jgi:hypothetical protein
MHLEAPFRFPIKEFSDVERAFIALATSREVATRSIALTEGADLLVKELRAERRDQDVRLVTQARTAADIVVLLRMLWDHPLTEQRPRFLRVEATLTASPSISLSFRIDVPTREASPRWMDVEVDRDPRVRAQQLQVLRTIGQAAGLSLLDV